VKRGELVTVAMSGDFGKPRPALVVQSDLFEETGTVTVLLLSGTLEQFPKSVQRFSDKNCGENKQLEQISDSIESHSALVDAPLIRLTIQPTQGNGLRKPSQVQIDKAMSVKRDKLGSPFGCLDDETMLSVTRSLAVFLGIT